MILFLAIVGVVWAMCVLAYEMLWVVGEIVLFVIEWLYERWRRRTA